MHVARARLACSPGRSRLRPSSSMRLLTRLDWLSRRTRLLAKGWGCVPPLPNTAAKLLLPSSSEVCGREMPSVSLRRCCIRCASEAAASLEDPCDIWGTVARVVPNRRRWLQGATASQSRCWCCLGPAPQALQRLVGHSICFQYPTMQHPLHCAMPVSSTTQSTAA